MARVTWAFAAALAAALAAAAAGAAGGLSTMGPLVPDSTILDGCASSLAPGVNNTDCADSGVQPDAASCAAACEGTFFCSGVTWHGPTTGEWAGRCVFRKDNVTSFRACGAGCDHTSAVKTSGWRPFPPPPPPVWPPLAAGWTGLVKPFWFGANTSGLDSNSELELLSKHSVAGFGWQQGSQDSSRYGREEALLAAAATHARDYFTFVNSSTVLFIYRQIQVCCEMFALCVAASALPEASGFWLTDPASGERCLAPQPWGTSDPMWNFSAPGATAWWVSNIIGELTSEAALTTGPGAGAVFFDETDQGQCGYRGSSCDFGAFSQAELAAQQASSNDMLAKSAAALNAANLIPIYSSINRLAASSAGLPGASAPCALPEDATLAALANSTHVRFYEGWPGAAWSPNTPDVFAANIANALLETAAGVPVVLHAGGACPAPARNITRPGRLGGDIEFSIASYLVVADAGTTLSISNDWYDQYFCWRPDFDVDFGAPLGLAQRTGAHSWTRNFTRANVAIDVSAGPRGAVDLLA